MPGQQVTTIADQDGEVSISFRGRMDAETLAGMWREIRAKTSHAKRVSVDASAVEYCDGAGLAMLWELQTRNNAGISGLKPDIQKLLAPFADMPAERPAVTRKPDNAVVALGKIGTAFLADLQEQVAFIGKLTATLAVCIANPRRIRWADMWIAAQRAGVNAVVIVGLISFLTGLILAFQSSVPLKQYGASIFAVNLVTLAMLREMGVIMTAVVFAGRSGSAFAAEIGTMKVNEEINALTTMGLDPVRFLVVPRVLAALIVVPALTIYADLLGVSGGLFVMLCQGFTWPSVWNQLTGSATVNDVLAGLIKSFVFGVQIAGIGCMRGLQTKSGASSVGQSTTSSVVTGIFMVVVTDALFAFIYYELGF